MTLRLISIFLLTICNAYGQSESDQKSKLSLKFAPLSLIDFYSGSSYRGGVEIDLTKHFSIYQECGGYFKKFNGQTNTKGYVLKSELRYYLSSTDPLYLSIEYFYKRQNYNYGDSIYFPTQYNVAYNVDKYVTAFTLKSGSLILLNKYFYIDIFGGLGIRYKNIRTNLSESEKEHRWYYNDSMSQTFMNGDRKGFVLNIDVGVKIGFNLLSRH